MAVDSWWLVRHQSGEVKLEMAETAYAAVMRMKWSFQECKEFTQLSAEEGELEKKAELMMQKMEEEMDALEKEVSDGH